MYLRSLLLKNTSHKLSLLLFGLTTLLANTASALTTGDIAFVGYNSDGNDHIAFVALTDIASGESITFEDNEWNGTGWIDTNEGAFVWTSNATVVAGTVVSINNIGSGTINASSGTVIDASVSTPSRGTNRGIGSADETLYAWQGSATSPTFITALASGGFNATGGLLTGTGLTSGTNAIDLSVLDDDCDIAAYNGTRTGYADFAAVRTAVNAVFNWISQDGTGDQSIDPTPPNLPFSSTAFSTGSVNQTPTALALSADNIAENVAANSSVGTLSTTDPDAGNTFTYTLVSGTGSTDNTAFNISGSSLRITAPPDFETKSSYAVRVRTTDQGDLFFEREFTITITDGNDAPTFSGYTAATPYQTTAAISFGKLLTQATDLEGQALTVTAAGPTSAQGGTAVLQSGSILYTPAIGFSGADTFPVTITDALGASGIGTVTVNVHINTGVGTNAPVLTVMSGGRMGVGFQGIPGRPYRVQRSTNLDDWSTLTTITAAADGAVTYIDDSPPPGTAFYRLRKP